MVTLIGTLLIDVVCIYFHYYEGSLSLDMMLLIFALNLIVCAIKDASNDISKALSHRDTEETPSSPNDTNPDDEESYYFEDSDEYPYLHR